MINFHQHLFPQWNSWRPRRSGKVAHNYFIFISKLSQNWRYIFKTYLLSFNFVFFYSCFFPGFLLDFVLLWTSRDQIFFSKHCVSSVALMKAQEQLYEIQTEVKRQVTKIYSWTWSCFFKWICLNNIYIDLYLWWTSQLPTSELPSWGAILRWAILSTSIIRIAHPN